MKFSFFHKQSLHSSRASRQHATDAAGQSLVIVALVLVGILAFAGLVFDGGSAYVTRRNMQNAADAAALAGAREFLLREDNSAATEQKILNAINTFASNNGAPTQIVGYFVDNSNNQVGAQIGLNGGVPGALSYDRVLHLAAPLADVGNTSGIKVVTQRTFTTLFLGVVSEQLGTAGALAIVQTGKASLLTGIMPIAVPRCYVDPTWDGPDLYCGAGDQTDDPHVILGQGSNDPSGLPDSSFRGAINFRTRWVGGTTGRPGSGGTAAPGSCGDGNKQDAERYVRNGGYNNECGELGFNQRIDSLTGNSAGNVIDAMDDTYPVGSVVLVCVYQPPLPDAGHGTSARIPCLAVAPMEITDYTSNTMSAKYAKNYIVAGPIVNSGAPSWQKVYALEIKQ